MNICIAYIDLCMICGFKSASMDGVALHPSTHHLLALLASPPVGNPPLRLSPWQRVTPPRIFSLLVVPGMRAPSPLRLFCSSQGPLVPPRRSPFLDVQPGGSYKVFPFVICGKFLPSTTESEIYTQVDTFTGSWIQLNTAEASDERASFSQTSGPALPCKFEL